MDEKIGLWVKSLPYVWVENEIPNKCKRFYLLEKYSAVVDGNNEPFLLGRKKKDSFLFPTRKSCGKTRNFLRVCDVFPLTWDNLKEKFGENVRVKVDGKRILNLEAKIPMYYYIGKKFKAAVPQEFVGVDPFSIKAPIQNMKTGEIYKNIWELANIFSVKEITTIHQLSSLGRGDYRYFWKHVSQQTKLKARQLADASFDFFLAKAMK